jgi:hypothetical protein
MIYNNFIGMRKKQRSICFVFFHFLFITVFLAPLFPQQDINLNLQHEVTVILNLVQVFVVDRSGRPVTDLKASDFELFENGRTKKITGFEKHTLHLPGQAKTENVEKKQAFAPPSINRKFFLFFDFAFNTVSGIKMAKDAARHFIQTQVKSGDEVGIISYSTEGLKLYEYLTTDKEKILQGTRKRSSRESKKSDTQRPWVGPDAFWKTWSTETPWPQEYPMLCGWAGWSGGNGSVSPDLKKWDTRPGDSPLRSKTWPRPFVIYRAASISSSFPLVSPPMP